MSRSSSLVGGRPIKSTHWIYSRGPTRLGISLGVHFLEERFLELCGNVRGLWSTNK